jgi:hypothetical protein
VNQIVMENCNAVWPIDNSKIKSDLESNEIVGLQLEVRGGREKDIELLFLRKERRKE